MLRKLAFVAASLALVSGAALAQPPADSAPIVLTAFNGDAAGVQSLIASGASPNTPDSSGFTPLNWAAYRGHLEVAKVLVDAGADLNAQANKPKWTPLMNAVGTNHGDVAGYLIEKGADVTLIDDDGLPAIYWAADWKNAYLVKLLLERGSDSAIALIATLRRGSDEALLFLLDGGANVNAAAPDRDYHYKRGDTVLLKAAEGNRADIVSLLLSRGADPNLASPQPFNMTTALHYAAYYCNAEMARALVASGASLYTPNAGGSTALDLARSGWTSGMQACGADVLTALGG